LNLPLNPALKDLQVYQPGKPIEEVARELNLPAENIIKLASNENPLGPSPAAVAAMRKVLDGINLYPDGNSYYLKEKLAGKLRVDPANLILGNGSNEIIEFVGHAVMGPGVEVIVSQYCFLVFPLVTRIFHANLVTVPAKYFGHDLGAILSAITPATRVIFIANPNNPTGTAVAPEQLAKFISAVPSNVLLVIDEAYIEFLDKPFDSIGFLTEHALSNLLLMRTFSKIFGLAGLRIGYGIGCADLVAALEKVRQPFNINAIAQAGALAALEDQDHIANTRSNNAAGLRCFSQAFQKMGLEFVPSAANFILLRVGDGQRVFEALQKDGIIVRPMSAYQLVEWIRITVGTPEQNQRCLEALRKNLSR
jgi:histidinol-phosphate aminotransferase